ncbi:TonB-linked SusC/RagA family outer membrane protein [Dysgonomonas hofstadii]|uniref:TonB-linked SusC/RagA family outer membrane protein n=1 Tax=Dysgonomonas hofstadii TaxID=637886 RepID=A0A840CHZ3_9BACT|nr:TonB-dependent receptor [Dysgonomonas hofstadii]MBB4034916.1 TonB-linked SusC/RagA family outer membrane protein [Dysgonomonas hofstadii]
MWKIKRNLSRFCYLGTLFVFSLTISASTGPIENEFAQTQQSKKKITGTVNDQSGPLIGVTVSVDGTTNGTMTDDNGNFILSDVPEGAKLKISYVGYKTQIISIGGQATFDITLEEENQQLDEVIVVGYGTQKKSDYTGAVSAVGEKELRMSPGGNIASVLQGLGAGVQISKSGGNNHPGSTPRIRIRGTRSLSGGNDPLVVVDGIPFDGSLNDINPDDVVSSQILKDASATAIYGSRGSNGVILINTRKGQEGEARVSYSGYVGFNKSLGKYDVYRDNGDGLLTLKKWAQINANPEGTFTGMDDPNLYSRAMTFTPEIEGYEAGVGTDWQDLIYSDGLLTNHQVSVSGGTKKTQYAFSIGYYNAEGSYKMQSMERYSIKLSIDQQIGKYVKVGLNSLNSYVLRNGTDINPIENSMRISPYVSPYNEDGSLRFEVNNAPALYNPLADFDENALVDRRKKLSTFTTGYLEIDFTHGFKYKFNAGVNLSHDTQGKYYAANTTKQSGGTNWANNLNYDDLNLTIENIFTYDKVINDTHTFNFTGLYSWQESKKENLNLQTSDLLADMYQYYNPAFGTFLSNSGGYERWDLLSWMGRLNYNYKQRYYLTGTVRSDGSSRLAKGNRWNTYGSGSFMWNVGNESFMADQKTLSMLKFRLSYGRVGSTAVSPYGTLGSLTGVKYNYGSDGVLGYYSRKAPNTGLGWENTTTWNLGIDYGFLNNRISGSIELYSRKTTDLLLSENYPITSGVADAIMMNVGATKGKGIELNLNAVILDGDGDKTVKWNTNLNIFADRSKISRLQDGVSMNTANGWFVNEPIGVFYDYKRVGIWQDTPEDRELIMKLYNITSESEVRNRIGTVRVLDANGGAYLDGSPDGLINSYDKVILGQKDPDFEGAMTNTVNYKNFDFSLMLYFKVGGLMKSDLHDSWANTLQGSTNNLKVNYWTPENRADYWPKPNANKQWPDYRSILAIMDASYLKVKNITLGYTVPKSTLSKLGIGSARVYTTVSNPFTFFSEYVNDFGGLDPETDGSVGINTPATWSMIFGLNLSF